MAFSFQKVNDSLLQVLECPVCLDYMTAPITLCKNGHSICSSCKTKQENCPTCREEFSAVRVLALEQLSEVAAFPCENKEAGCEAKLLMADKLEHFRKCPYRLYECIAGTGGPCGWKGRKTELFEHVNKKHPESAWMKATANWNFELNTRDSSFCQLIQAHGELFWFHFEAIVDEEINMAIQYIGPEEKSGEFTYEITFEAKDKPEKFLYRFPTHKEADSAEDIFKSGWCASLAWRFTSLFFQKGKFYCAYIVSKNVSCLYLNLIFLGFVCVRACVV